MSNGVKFSLVGRNDANNQADTSLVASNPDGSVLERLEHVQGVLAGLEPVEFTPSSAPMVDEDGGRVAVHVSIVDRNTGAVASANINITGATYELAKSTGGGAFSTVGVTQPTGATKANGEVELEFDFNAAEWAVGDTYRLKLGGVTVTVGATTYYMGTLAWVGEVGENLDVKAAVDDINADLGEPTDAAVDPDGGAGSLHAKMAGVGARVGDNTEAATDPSAASGTVLSKLRGAGVDLDTIIAELANGTYGLAALETLVDDLEARVGNNTEAATDPSAASGTLYSKVRGVGVDLDALLLEVDSLEENLGAPADVAVEPDGGVGSLHAKVAGIGDQIEAPTADSAENTLLRDVVGNKSDAASLAATASSHAIIRALAKTGGTAIAASKSLVDAVGNTGDAPIPVADNTTAAGSSSLQATLGRKDDTLFNPSDAPTTTATFMRYVKSAFTRVRTPPAADDGTAAGDSNLGETIGRKDDTATNTIGTATTLMRYVKGLVNRLNDVFRSESISEASKTDLANVAFDLYTKGTVTGSQRFRLNDGWLRVNAMGSQTSITFKLFIERGDGTEEQFGSTITRVATGAFHLYSELNVHTPLVNRRFRVEIQGNNAATDGSVSGRLYTEVAGV